MSQRRFLPDLAALEAPALKPSLLPMRLSVAAVTLALSAWSVESIAQLQQTAPRAPQRLSNWLLSQDNQDTAYPTGLSWRVPEERPAQLGLKLELLQFLGKLPAQGSSRGEFQPEGLAARLSAMPVTGRVPVALGDARWLQGSPQRDPLLLPGHTVDVPVRPRTVSVLTPNGVQCRVDHVPGQEALAYVRACAALNGSAADWAWVAQPDGRIERYGIAIWNQTAQDPPAPGAWIWSPPRNLRLPEWFSDQLIRFLATQGPALDTESQAVVEVPPTPSQQPSSAGGGATGLRWSSVTRAMVDPAVVQAPAAEPLPMPQAVQQSVRSRDAVLTSNDWGLVGALQTPSARMRSAGSFVFSTSRVEPYTRWNVMAQPFSWMEAGFRYTDVANIAYGPTSLSGDQSYKDKGFDVKFGLWSESALWPEISLGFTDIVGTGLFSSEYLVASKRLGTVDASLGLAWGYMAGATRLQFSGPSGGEFSFNNYFSGTPKPFGSVQWMTPWQPLLLKAEYDANTYQNEPLGNRFEQKSKLNFGLVYRPYSWMDLTAGFERGNQLMLGLSIHTDVSKMTMPKLSDPARVPVVAERPATTPDWNRTARDLGVQTGWQVSRIQAEGKQVAVTVDEPVGVYWQDRVDRAASVLHRDAPGDVDRFVLRYQTRGMPLSEQVVERDGWVAARTQPLPPSQQRDNSLARDARSTEAAAQPVFEDKGGPWKTNFRIGYSQSVGGPDSAILYQIYAEQSAQLQLFGRKDTWLSGSLRYSLLNNYDEFKYTAPSNLPRVRTYMREYLTTSDLTMPNLQVTHARKIADNQYVSAYAGYLEEMFAGFGGEWLYRPFASRVAFGVDANLVRQRGFEQNFDMLSPTYDVATGHATLYWDTGWHGVDVRASVGRYLAKDLGGTLEMSRRFSNGVIFGAYATKTNVSAEQFGEGSFDKGLFIGIPFDAMFTRSSGTTGFFNWKPLTRDGGAKLWRQEWLYDITRTRDLRTMETKAAPPANANLMPADHQSRWQPPAEAKPAYTAAVAPVADPVWRADAGPTLKLIEALDRQGFRNVVVDYDGSHRLNLKLAHERLKPLSRAVGRAARTALNLAPAEVREIRIQLAEVNDPLVEYDFFDLRRLRAHLAGELPASELKNFVAVRYLHQGARESDPLAQLADIASVSATLPLKDVLPGALYYEPRRVIDDFGLAAKEVGRVDWVNAVGVSLLAVGGSSLLDSRGLQFAKDHANASWLKGINSVGNALPWLGLAGAGVLALDSSDPRRARTGLSAAEAGVTAAVAATGLKYVFGRARPNSGLSKNDFEFFSGDSTRGSMPSRHTAVAWAVATPFAEEYKAPWLYGVAAITNLARIGKQEHWVSDTVAGSLLGYGIGRLFWESSRANSTLPQVMVDPSGVTMSWTYY
jgi:membrane-associated phospholipid phosphatase